MGLTRTMQHNIGAQAHQSKADSKPLAHMRYTKTFENPLVKILSKKGSAQKDQPVFEESELKQEEAPAVVAQEEKDSGSNGDFGLLGDLFEMTGGQGSPDLNKQDELESDASDDEFYNVTDVS